VSIEREGDREDCDGNILHILSEHLVELLQT